MKIIIAGDGKVGATLVRQLSAEEYDLTLVDVNPNRLDSSSERFDIMAVQGNCASMEVLKEAGVEIVPAQRSNRRLRRSLMKMLQKNGRQIGRKQIGRKGRFPEP